MMTILDYKIYPEEELIIEYGRGEVTIELFIEMKKRQFVDKEFNKAYCYIVDFRDTTFEINKKELNAFPDFLQANKDNWAERYAALITNTPRQVVFATQFLKMVKDTPMKYHIVSTEEAAADWISFPNSKVSELKMRLKDLVKDFYK